MARKRIGEILIQAGLIDEPSLRAALVEQRRYGGPLGRILVDLKFLLEDDLVAALSKQLAIPTINLDSLDISQAILDLVPGEIAEAHGVVPFAQPMKFLDVAMSDPTNQAIIDKLRVKTKLNLRPYLAGPKAIERAVAKYYGRGGLKAPNAGRSARGGLAVGEDPIQDPMELVAGFDLDHSVAPGASPKRTVFSNPGLTIPNVLEHPEFEHNAVEQSGSNPAIQPSSLATIASLQDRVAALEALVRRDEEVIKKLLALLIDAGIVTRDELVSRLK